MAPCWLVHGQVRTLRSGLLGVGSALPRAIGVPITVYGKWCWRSESNPQPDGYKSPALAY